MGILSARNSNSAYWLSPVPRQEAYLNLIPFYINKYLPIPNVKNSEYIDFKLRHKICRKIMDLSDENILGFSKRDLCTATAMLAN